MKIKNCMSLSRRCTHKLTFSRMKMSNWNHKRRPDQRHTHWHHKLKDPQRYSKSYQTIIAKQDLQAPFFHRLGFHSHRFFFRIVFACRYHCIPNIGTHISGSSFETQRKPFWSQIMLILTNWELILKTRRLPHPNHPTWRLEQNAIRQPDPIGYDRIDLVDVDIRKTEWVNPRRKNWTILSKFLKDQDPNPDLNHS